MARHRDDGHVGSSISLIRDGDAIIVADPGLVASQSVIVNVGTAPDTQRYDWPGTPEALANARYLLPVMLASYARASRERRPAPTGWAVDKLNDQHAYLRVEPGHGLQVGDRVVLGISHPCTTFDKWRWMPVVDDDYGVVDAIVTCF